jgi:hypothetical protein
MSRNMEEIQFVSRIGTCVLVGFVSLLLMWKLITLHVGFVVAFLTSFTFYILYTLLAFNFEKSLLWENYLKEVDCELQEVEEYHKFLDNHWKQWLLKE